MPGGGTLTFRASTQRGRIVLDVIDTGPGVPEARRSARIFEPYFTTDAEQGTGLGLAVARSLVRAPRRRPRLPAASGKGAASGSS